MATAKHARKHPDCATRAQYAVLPWRVGSQSAMEVLLITSRETRRWVIPKGWPIKGLTPARSASQEAFEEAGLSGVVSPHAIGAFQYEKRLRSGRKQPVIVSVFPLEVCREEVAWPEFGQREKRWLSALEAAQLVDEPELQALIQRFAGAA
jgi:8-oxo-dGTP pyrophosphatase MutT (NUDIX family)